MKNFLWILCAAAVLSACGNNMKTKMGMVKQSPDEYMVISRAPLTLPPDYDYKPVNEMSRTNGGEYKYQDYTAGEQTLLKNMNAHTTPDDIKKTIDEELKQLND